MKKQTMQLAAKFGRLSNEEMKNINGGVTPVGRFTVPKSICASGYGLVATGCQGSSYPMLDGYTCVLTCL
ncbi:hypothetical protein PQ462_22860 [Flavobacterium sp. KACC 22758]|jgi:hypothetical protein|uniref:hypothetical protein n=1 Tax=Flavobacterium sp. KACC 22758 TaxID=3025667 RepID=UPI002365A92D|nr:hypothetical protein [Flavobacterium sp. KACC 22758]WDF59539.1 hypothetical protein PQ462_22860 [Flavobacterium sp. KACC 22758]